MKPSKENYSKEEYEKLRHEWYEKLKKEGFKDIENEEGVLQTWTTNVYNLREKNSITTEAKQTYYRMAAFFLNDYAFKSERDKIIWEHHSNGVSMRKLEKLLKNTPHKRGITKICHDINRLAKIMKAGYGTKKS